MSRDERCRILDRKTVSIRVAPTTEDIRDVEDEAASTVEYLENRNAPLTVHWTLAR